MPAPAIKKIKGKIVERKVDDLVPHPDNAREHSEQQVASLAGSIKKFGFTVPVLVDGEGTILSGHGRVLAAKSLGMDRVPTLDVSHLSEAEKKAFLIADNKLYEHGGWNAPALDKLIVELDGIGFELELLGIEPDTVHAALRESRTGFLGAGDKADSGEGDGTGRTRVTEFVQLNFTVSASDRKVVMDVLKREQQRRGLATSSEALVAMCAEMETDP